METTFNNQFNTEELQPARPQFLKVLCILSFIACGLMILIFAIGTMCLALDADTIESAWQQIVTANPKLEDVDPVVFFHEAGIVSFYCLIANIVSLVGVIMMWRLEKIGLIVYAIAELATHFFSIDTGEAPSYGLMIFSILIDVAFIVMYYISMRDIQKKPVETVTNPGF